MKFDNILKAILNYQFGNKVGDKIIKNFNIKYEISRNTGRLRRVYIGERLLGTIEPSTGFFIPTFYGGEIIKNYLEYPKYRVIVSDEAVPFVEQGKSVFNKFVIDVYEEILPKDIVLVVDKKDNLLQVGEAVLSSKEMLEFNVGVAVKPKHSKK